jgi:hypothetical protein
MGGDSSPHLKNQGILNFLLVLNYNNNKFKKEYDIQNFQPTMAILRS